MRHLTKGRILGRKMPHRRAMFRNLATSLFAHERIRTTVAKAKELRPFAEKIITVARKGAVAVEACSDTKTKLNECSDEERAARLLALKYRRQLISLLGGKKTVIVGDDEVNVIDKLLKDIGVRFRDRQGGYTRIVKSAERHVGDAAPVAYIELLGAGETKEPKASPQPAPTVADE